MNFTRIWAWYLLLVPMASYVAAGCVLDVSARNVQLRLGEHGYPDQVCLAAIRAFASDDRSELQAELARVAIAGHLEPLVHAVRPFARTGMRALQLIVADTLIQALLWAIDHFQSPLDADVEAAAFLQLLAVRGQTGVLWIEHGGAL